MHAHMISMSTQPRAHITEFTLLRPPNGMPCQNCTGAACMRQYIQAELLLTGAAYNERRHPMKSPGVPNPGGAAGGTRTHNLPITRRLLCQLSYDSINGGAYRFRTCGSLLICGLANRCIRPLCQRPVKGRSFPGCQRPLSLCTLFRLRVSANHAGYEEGMVRMTGIEPAARRLKVCCSPN